MILLIDNYDSFSYNLYQLIGSINPDIKVVRNDQMTIEEIRALKPERIILSPGPGFPKDAGICIEAAKKLGKEIPVFGVCLGHQAICEAFGATVSYASQLMHGKQSMVTLDTDCVGLFIGQIIMVNECCSCFFDHFFNPPSQKFFSISYPSGVRMDSG